MALYLKFTDTDFADRFKSLMTRRIEHDMEASKVAQAILDEVRAHGDDALCALTEKYDGFTLTPEQMRVSKSEMKAALGSVPPADRQALELATARITAYHERQKPKDDFYQDEAGVKLGHKWSPVAAAGLYVPGGTASYPSSVLMNALPAKVAGVVRCVMAVPAPEGRVHPMVLAAAELAGIDEIYRIGGAQAIAALAFGTKTIAPVDVITGPGNAYVAAAKRLVYGRVGIDLLAGPSEILVLADGDNNPDWIAMDLLSQAEHDEAAQAILITDSASFASAVEEAMTHQLATLPRGAIAAKSWDAFGAIIEVPDLSDAPALINELAPEHVELAIADADAFAAMIHNAGAIFMGRYTPEAVGDYIAGTNHVLPTMRTARFASGLSVYDFMKRSALIACDADSLSAIGGAAIRLAESEGLDAHARSIAMRLNK